MQGSVLIVPRSLKAKTPESLEKLMLKNNFKHGYQFNYSISFGSGWWVAWYYNDKIK